jgi:hypothetical protein
MRARVTRLTGPSYRLGPVAEHAGAARVLAGAVTGVALGAGLMTVPGPGVLAVAGLMVLGLAAAPIFPLLTLTRGDRTGPRGADMTQAVGVQVAASAVRRNAAAVGHRAGRGRV